MVATILFDVRRKTVKRAKDLKESAEMHRHIYRAIRDRDSDAARNAMRDHLMLAQKAQEAEEPESPDALASTSADHGEWSASTSKNVS